MMIAVNSGSFPVTEYRFHVPKGAKLKRFRQVRPAILLQSLAASGFLLRGRAVHRTSCSSSRSSALKAVTR